MTVAEEILSELSTRGVTVRVRGDELKLKPARALDADLVRQLREYKSEIILSLRQSLAPCGSPHCGGCYSVGEGRKIHPPKASSEWIAWHQTGNGEK